MLCCVFCVHIFCLLLFQRENLQCQGQRIRVLYISSHLLLCNLIGPLKFTFVTKRYEIILDILFLYGVRCCCSTDFWFLNGQNERRGIKITFIACPKNIFILNSHKLRIFSSNQNKNIKKKQEKEEVCDNLYNNRIENKIGSEIFTFFSIHIKKHRNAKKL